MISGLYQSVTDLRNYFYDRGWLTVESVSCPVISVGNLTMGGTGKTPFVDLLLRFCENEKLKVGVVSRGYGRRTRGVIEVGTDPEAVGDEPVLLKKKHAAVPMFVGERRAEASRQLLRRHPEVRLIVADDAFQHRGLKRNIDVVLIDGSRPAKALQMFPKGWAREHLKHLLRADYLVVTKGQGDNKELYEVLSAHTRRSVFERLIECQTRYGVTTDLLTGAAQPISLQSRILAVSGIGSPEPFEQAVQTQFAPREVRSLRYRDHYNYALKDLHSIGHLAQDFDWVVTTEKDAIKLRSLIVSTGFAAGNRWRVLPMIFEASASIERLYENIRSLALSSL